MPLHALKNLVSLIVFDIELVASFVMPLPLPLFRLSESGGFGLSSFAEHWKENLHERVVGVVATGPYADFGVRVTLYEGVKRFRIDSRNNQ